MKSPEPYIKLDAWERKTYNRICGWLSDKGHLEDVDNFIICNAVKSLSLAKNALIEMSEPDKGAVQTFENGTRQVSPEWAVWKNSIKDFETCARHLGLSPKIRQDMDFEMPTVKNVDPIMALMNRKVG